VDLTVARANMRIPTSLVACIPDIRMVCNIAALDGGPNDRPVGRSAVRRRSRFIE
jgi:hypothetical protein